MMSPCQCETTICLDFTFYWHKWRLRFMQTWEQGCRIHMGLPCECGIYINQIQYIPIQHFYFSLLFQSLAMIIFIIYINGCKTVKWTTQQQGKVINSCRKHRQRGSKYASDWLATKGTRYNNFPPVKSCPSFWLARLFFFFCLNPLVMPTATPMVS